MVPVRACLALFLIALTASADIPMRPVTSDLDAEFARAADLLEAGQRARASTVLSEIARKAGQRAWHARISLLLAGDDERRKDYASAEKNLRAAEAAAIGLEPYRRVGLGRVFEATGRRDAAIEEWRSVLDSAEPFARRTAVSRDLARALEKSGRVPDAVSVLNAAATAARGGDFAEIGIERIRLALTIGDARTVASAARELLFRAASLDAARST